MGGNITKRQIFIETSTILVVSPSNCSPASIILQFLNHHLPAAPHLLLYQAPPNLRSQCILEASGDAFEVYKPFHLGRPKHGEWEHLGKCQDFFVERKTQLVVGTPWGFRNFTSSVRFLRMSCTKTSRKALALPLFANQPWECLVHPYNVSKGTDANFSSPTTSETLWNMQQNKIC